MGVDSAPPPVSSATTKKRKQFPFAKKKTLEEIKILYFK